MIIFGLNKVYLQVHIMPSVNFKVLWQLIQVSQICRKDRPILAKINYRFMIVVKIILCNSSRLSNRLLHLLRHQIIINREEKEISHKLLIQIANSILWHQMTAKRIIKFINNFLKGFNWQKIQCQLLVISFKILEINNSSTQ
jgi:hypothetical protein